jgi:hypothetical protein
VTWSFPKPYIRSLIVPIFKSGDKNNASNQRTIMISLILAKLYGIILENKINMWLEIHGRDKGHARFRIYHSTVDHLATLKIVREEFRNNKSISYVVLLTLENILTRYLELTFEEEIRRAKIFF